MFRIEGKWSIETRKQRMEGGGSCETTEKVRVLSRDNGKRIIEAIVLTDKDIDSSGNISENRGKGYHYVALMDGKKQLSFAIDFTKVSLGWRVLSDDCISFVQDVETKTAAIELLTIASTQSNARTSDEAWKQEPIPSEEEIRAEQGEAEAADKRDAEKQEAEEEARRDRVERNRQEVEWWLKEKERALEIGTLDEVATADKNIRILTKRREDQ